MREDTQRALGACLVVAIGAGAIAQPIDLDYNWNGMVHSGEESVGFADDPDGFRAMSDRAMRFGQADSLGGESLSLTTPGGMYEFEGAEGVLDIVMVGTRAANGQIGWDAVPDGDEWGIQPSWDPTGGSAVSIESTTAVGPVMADQNFKLSFLYNASIGVAISRWCWASATARR